MQPAKQPTYKLCIIGSGVVGLATGNGFENRGHNVTYVDTNPETIKKLKHQGKDVYTPETLRKSGLKHEVYFLSVSSPTQDGNINLNYLEAASKNLGKHIASFSDYPLIVVRSTVPPGTTENIVVKHIETHSKKKVGKDFGICMNPEYLREITAKEDFDKPWIVVIGEYDQRSGDVLHKIYESFNCPIYRTTLQEAEIQKYIHNLFNAVKITFFNEMRELCNNLDISPDNVFRLVAKSAEGMWNPNYGIKNLGPYQGNCLPKDTQAFYSWAKKRGWGLKLLGTTIQVNNRLITNKS